MFLRLRLLLLLLFSFSSSSSVHNFNNQTNETVTTMKSGYNNTIRKGEGELKPLTNNAAIPETGEIRITKKRLVLVSLGLLIMGLIMGHLTNTQHSGLPMSQKSITAQLVDSKEDVSICIPPCVHQWIKLLRMRGGNVKITVKGKFCCNGCLSYFMLVHFHAPPFNDLASKYS